MVELVFSALKTLHFLQKRQFFVMQPWNLTEQTGSTILQWDIQITESMLYTNQKVMDILGNVELEIQGRFS